MGLNKFKILFCICLLFFSAFVFSQNPEKIDSLENALSNAQQDTARLNTLVGLANEYINRKEFQEADKYITEAFNFAMEQNLKTTYYLHWAKADILFYHKEYTEALSEMEIAVKKVNESGNVEEIARAKNFMGWIYLYNGKFTNCIDTYTKNIELAKSKRLESILPEAYSGLAYVNRNLGDTEEQRKYLNLMVQSSLNEQNTKYAAEAYFRLGDLGMNADSNFVFAIKQYRECLKLRKKQNDSSYIAYTLLRIGWNYYLNKELDTALNYFFYSLDYSIPLNRLTNITNAYGNIGTIYRDKKEYDKAIEYYKKSIKYSEEANDWYNLSWLYKDMSDMYKSQENYKKAYENLIKHKQFSDSVEVWRYNTDMAEARSKYEADKAEKELELVTFKLNQHKYYTYGFAGITILLVLIGLLLIRQNKLNSKRKISEMNHKISEMTQKNLRQQMNPHFIFNTLNSIQYYMYQHDKISTNNYLTKFASLMRKTLENSQHTSIPIKDEIDALELYLQLEALRFKEKFDYTISVDEEIDTLLYKIPTMLIQPYVENAIIHGLINKDDKGFLKVELKLEDNCIGCTIEDNGIGREAAQIIKKNKNGNHNSLGTTITESRLKLVNSLYGRKMKILYTDLKDTNGHAAGTKVEIHIPIIT